MILAQAAAVIPPDMRDAVIAALVAAVLVLAGLWVRAHDQHRQWSTEQIHAHARLIAVLESEYAGIRDDLAEIKALLGEHTKHDRRIHEALIRKFDLQVAGE